MVTNWPTISGPAKPSFGCSGAILAARAKAAPEEVLAALTAFLAPYRDGPAGATASRPRNADVK